MKPTEFKEGAEGAFYGLPEPVYRKAEGLNHSLLKHMRPTPAHYLHAKENPREPSWEMKVGTLVHASLLEPEKPLPGIAIRPKQAGFASSKEGKAWKAAALDRGDIILGEDAYESLTRCIESCKSNERLRDVCENADTEVSLFAMTTRGMSSVMRKGRIDIVPSKYACLCDIKVVDDASPDAWQKKMLDFEYPAQAAWYLRLWNDVHKLSGNDALSVFMFHVVERATGFIAHYAVHPAALQWGEERNEADLLKYLHCRDSQSWPAYNQDGVIANLPVWAYSKPIA